MPLAPVIDLTALDGTNGFQIPGAVAGDRLGHDVAVVGDLNGDGVADFVVSSSAHDADGRVNSGVAYVVFGRTQPGPAVLQPTSLDGSNGFRIIGPAGGNAAVLAAPGDVNGDGLADLVVGAPGADGPGGTPVDVGEAYLIFGRADGFAATIDASALTPADGRSIAGRPIQLGRLGYETAGAGDFDGDGFGDFIISEFPPNYTNTLYLYYGRPSFPGQLQLGDAVRIVAPSAPGSGLGFRVETIGDLNGDGRDDLVITSSFADPQGRQNANIINVLFGGERPASGEIDVATGPGFAIHGVSTSQRVAAAVPLGDIDGDGDREIYLYIDDSTKGAAGPTSSLILLGQGAGFPPVIDLTNLQPAQAVRMTGPELSHLAACGDVNGDGVDDFLVAHKDADTAGDNAFLVFGRIGGFPANLDISTLGAGEVVKFGGVSLENSSLVIGDVNGDGLDDVLLSRVDGHAQSIDSGAVYVVFGQSSTAATTAADTLTGLAATDRIKALGGDDLVTGAGGNDWLHGGPGTDKSAYAGSAKDYAWWQARDGTWRVQDLRNDSPEGTDTLIEIEQLQFSDRTLKIAGATTAERLADAYENVMRKTASGADQTFLTDLTAAVTGGAKTLTQAYGEIVQKADGTTAVAALTYQFFLGFAPSKGGFDYLVSPTGPNPNNINSAYFQFFSMENRYINFAVSVGSLGEGKPAFEAAYGALTLRAATREAYETIFGNTPGEAKLDALLDANVGNGLTRKDYFAVYGGDGLEGLGTKAAMVGWLLTEAAKADAGFFARSSNAYLADLADGAQFLVDMVGTYAQPDWTFGG